MWCSNHNSKTGFCGFWYVTAINQLSASNQTPESHIYIKLRQNICLTSPPQSTSITSIINANFSFSASHESCSMRGCSHNKGSWSFSSGQSMQRPRNVHATTKEPSTQRPRNVPAQRTLYAHSLHGQSMQRLCNVYATSMQRPCTAPHEHRPPAGH